MNFFKLFKWSITEPKLYPLMSHTSIWGTLGYLLGLVLIMSSVFGYKANADFQSRISKIDVSLREELPEFTLKDGKFTLKSNRPFIRDYDGFLVALDNTGTKSEALLNSYPAGIFINQDKVVSKQQLEQREFKLKELPELVLTKKDVLEALPMLRWGFLIIWPILFILLCIYKLVSVYALSLFGMVIQRTHRLKLRYRQIWNMSLFALTLPIVLDFWLSLMGWQFEGSDIFFWLIGMGYLWLGLAGFRRTDLQA